MLKRLKKLLGRLWEANVETIQSRRIEEWSSFWWFASEGEVFSKHETTAAQLSLKLRDNLKIVIQPGLSKYEAGWIVERTVIDLEHIAEKIEFEKEQARELAVNAYKFLEESHE